MSKRACPVCGREIGVRKDGSLAFHYEGSKWGSKTCSGSLSKEPARA
jgi:hypothetical protein